MIYGFARQSGGHVRIYSEVGSGTMVCIYLPRHYGEEDVREAPPHDAGSPNAGRDETVLVIDDEPAIRMLVQDVLLEMGYASIEADDGPSGLKVLQGEGRVDLLITDVGLPGGMNGRQVADAARALRPKLKVLFITGYAENAAVGNGHLEPGMAVLTKPFSPHRDARGNIDNAVLVLHWTGSSGASLLTPEFIKTLFAPGRPLDANRYFLIVPDNLGHGRSTKPSDGLKAHFPHYGYDDLVAIQHRLVSETLGVRRLHAILGLSMGGMNAWQWAEAYPDDVGAIMPVVALPVAVSGRNLLWRRLAIDDIRDDPDWRNGDYVKPPMGFTRGFELLRLMIDGVPHLHTIISDKASAEDYLGVVAKQTALLDPNDIFYSLESSGDYDPEPGLGRIKARVFALNFSDDEFNPDVLQILETRMKRVKDGRYVVQKGSATTFGHLTMAHPALWLERVGDFMTSLDHSRSN